MAHGTPSNFIRQTVGSSVGTTDPETIDVSDASAFPDPSTSQYDIVIWDAGSFNRPDQDSDVEVLTVTARDTGTNTLTCDRAQQGTSNTTHPNTSDVIVAPLSQLDVNTVDAQTVTTDEGSTTNNTFIRASRGSDSSSTSSGTFINPFDGEDKDNRGEFNSSQEFSPDKTGEYIIIATVDIRGNTADGNTIEARIQNVTDSTFEFPVPRVKAPDTPSRVTFSWSDTFNSSKTYRIEVTNSDSSFIISAGDNTKGSIIWSVAQ